MRSFLIASTISLGMVAAIVGCDSSDDGSGHAGSAGTAGSSGAAGGGDGATITAAETKATTTVSVKVDAEGSGTGIIGAVKIGKNVGQVTINGERLPVVFYTESAWTGFSSFVVQGVAVASDRLYGVWLTCESGSLKSASFVGTNGTDAGETELSGTCAIEREVTHEIDVNFPAVSIRLPAPLDNVSVNDALLKITPGATGRVSVPGAEYSVIAFASHNCWTAECEGTKRKVLHLLIWNEEQKVLGLTQLSLQSGATLSVLGRSLLLPSAKDGVGSMPISATWGPE